MPANQVDPHIFVIFGATGNLTRIKLFPALYQLSAKGALKKKNVILGVSRKDLSDESFGIQIQSMLKDSGISVKEDDYSRWCTECLHYQTIGQGGVED